jgi:hypothetical protein
MDKSIRPTPPHAPAAATPTVAPKPPVRRLSARDGVLFVGMNKDAVQEAASLRKNGLVPVTGIFNAKTAGTVTIKANGQRQTCDLTTDSGLATFVGSLRLPAEQSGKVTALFREAAAKKTYSSHTAAGAMDELAQLAQVWAQAERGGRIPSRMVLSGHSIGDGVWGDGNGKLDLDLLAKLADAMPTAARAVEDLHMSACSSGGERDMDRLRAIFPQVKTIWAYSSSAPGAYSGAMTHLSRWERATRGTRANLDRQIAASTRKGENVAVWTTSHGYQDGSTPQPLDTVKQRAAASQGVLADYLSGKAKVDNPGNGPLRDYYNAVIRVLQRRELPDAERPAFEAQRDQTIRLLYFTKAVAPKFAAHYPTAIREGYAAVGMPAPDFAKLSREEAMTAIAAYGEAVGKLDAPPAAARTLQHLLEAGLRDLRADTIPITWV